MSLAALSDRLKELGRPIGLSSLSKVELGQRGIDLDDLTALSRALGVPPLQLIFPLGQERLVEVTPGAVAGAWTAARWFSGEGPFPTRLDEDRWVVAGSDFEDWEESSPAYFREQDGLIGQWNRLKVRLTTAADGDERRAIADLLDQAEAQLRRHRRSMRSRGLDPGQLTADLQHVDEEA